MSPNKNNGRDQAFFGLKCVMLALAVILLAVSVICGYTSPGMLGGLLNGLLDIGAMLLITVVMLFEIIPFIKLKNVGIRNIYREKDIEVENFVKFNKMLSDNSFRYHFQPIINAKTGDIYAYEALMRSPKEVGLRPMEVLKYAEISKQLYSIEYYTFFNTLRAYHDAPEKFGGKKMFINSIPSVMLEEKDLSEIRHLFGDITKNTVVEILENDEDTEESCGYFEKLRELFGCQIAIDDYGSGYSNEQKLLNNNPNYIKIDIMLIASIDSDMKKQLLVSNIIKFASQYGIKVLAEGVETKEELQKMIEMGVDLIQGFYCATPSAEVVQEISPEIKDFIIEQNIRCAKFNSERKVYKAEDGETIQLIDLVSQQYGTIKLDGGTVTVVGEPQHSIDINITTKPNTDCVINLENANLSSPSGACMRVGDGGRLTVNLVGENALNFEGILVPARSSLTLRGKGNLTVNCSRNNGIGIGGGYSGEFGGITVETEGKLTVNASGSKIACIGGGKQSEGASVRLVRGTISISGRGVQAIGIGSAESGFIFSSSASVKAELNGNEVVGIGCRNGHADISITGGVVNVDVGGDRVAGIGTFESENSKIDLSGGKIESFAHGKDAVCIGSLEGIAEIVTRADYVNAIGQGTKAIGIGSLGSLTIIGGTVRSVILAAVPSWFGNEGKNIVIIGGNIVSNELTVPLQAVNSAGDPLVPEFIDSKFFEKRILTVKSDYMYRATKIPEVEYLRVYVPKGSLTI